MQAEPEPRVLLGLLSGWQPPTRGLALVCLPFPLAVPHWLWAAPPPCWDVSAWEKLLGLVGPMTVFPRQGSCELLPVGITAARGTWWAHIGHRDLGGRPLRIWTTLPREGGSWQRYLKLLRERLELMQVSGNKGRGVRQRTY